MSIPRHILIVDDDANLRQMVANYLVDYNLRVTGVADGPAMRDAIARGDVDLVLLDLKLRSEDGMNLAREMRETSSVPIIMLTGRTDEIDRIMGLELGADEATQGAPGARGTFPMWWGPARPAPTSPRSRVAWVGRGSSRWSPRPRAAGPHRPPPWWPRPCWMAGSGMAMRWPRSVQRAAAATAAFWT